MGIINEYRDVKMIVSAPEERELRSFVQDREFDVVKVEPGIYNDSLGRTYPLEVDYLLLVDDGDDSSSRTCLRLYPMGYREIYTKYIRNTEGINFLYPTVDELIPMISGKDLIFTAHYAGNRCGVEDILNRKLRKNVFNIWNEKEYYLYNEYFDVRVFLKKVSDGKDDAAYMAPVDIRDLDVNVKLLSILRASCDGYYDDTLKIEYTAVSEKLKAQYFLTKFHSNRNWALDPVCNLNYRISAFTLPGSITEDAVAHYDSNKTARNVRDGSKYVIDSIHVGPDICFTLAEFNELQKRFHFNISLA